MSEQVTAAIIGACAVIIAALIAWLGGRGKVPLVIHTTETEYVPYPVHFPIESDEVNKGLIHYVKKLSSFIIILVFFAIFGGLGAWAGSIYWHETGWMIGLLIGLFIGYAVIRKVRHRVV